MTSTYEKLNELRNALDKHLSYKEAEVRILIKLANDNSTNLCTLNKSLHTFDKYYGHALIMDILLPKRWNMSNNIFKEEDLKNCGRSIKTIQEFLFAMVL